MNLFRCLVLIPVTSLLVTDVSNTTITVNWTSLNIEDGNYVAYYNISYSPFHPLLISECDIGLCYSLSVRYNI